MRQWWQSSVLYGSEKSTCLPNCIWKWKRKCKINQWRSKWSCKEDWNLLEKFVEHEFVYLTGAGAIKLYYRFIFWPIAVQGAELATGIAEQDEEMFGLATIDFVQYFLFGISIDYTGKYTIFDSIQNNATIRFGRWLLVELRTCTHSQRQMKDKIKKSDLVKLIPFQMLLAIVARLWWYILENALIGWLNVDVNVMSVFIRPQSVACMCSLKIS